MKRAALDRARTLKVWRLHLWQHEQDVLASGGRGKITCACDLQAGRFRKRKAFGCGKARCYICHGEKLLGIMKHRDYKQHLIEIEERQSWQKERTSDSIIPNLQWWG